MRTVEVYPNGVHPLQGKATCVESHELGLRHAGEAFCAWADVDSPLWSAWSDASALPRAEPPGAPGVYVLSVRRQDGTPIALPRLLLPDPHGVIAIGAAADLRSRIRELRGHAADAVGRSNARMAAWQHAHLRLSERFPGEIHVSWVESDRSKAVEAEIRTAYVRAFGEPPPLVDTFDSVRRRVLRDDAGRQPW